MSKEEKQILEEEIIEETAENGEIVEEKEEPVEEAIVVEDAFCEGACEEIEENQEECNAKGSKALPIFAILFSIIIVALSLVSSMNTNKYNMMYVDIYGETIQDLADARGMSLAELLEMYQLPADMPGNTNTNAADNMIPVGVKAEGIGSYIGYIKAMGILPNKVSDFEFYKMVEGIPADVTENTPYGEAYGRVKLKYIWEDEASLETYKAQYGLDDSVTLETEYREVRTAVDLYAKKELEAQKALETQIMNQVPQETETETEAE